MEDVIGGRTEDAAFVAFLASWRVHLNQRVGAIRDGLSAMDGISTCVLAGSVGRGQPWPLSDIDVIPILVEDAPLDLDDQIEVLRTQLMTEWQAEGWATGLDLGWLRFTSDEVEAALRADDPVSLIQSDRRWFHAMDKGFEGCPLFADPTGHAERLAAWWTAHRFDPEVSAVRRETTIGETRHVIDYGRAAVKEGDPVAATRSLRRAAHLVMIASLEGWGMRDNSLGRLGTRFARAAVAHDQSELVAQLDALTNLTDAEVSQRMACAPWWVWQRHERSIAARRAIGEDTTRTEDQRDTLRISADYGSREPFVGMPPVWLGIPPDLADVHVRLERLASAMDEIAAQR